MTTSITRRHLSSLRAPTPAAHARIPREYRRGTKRQVRTRDIDASRHAAR
ncbi:hypothetical protein [Actinomadura yumaensis]|uniref:Uncharacterized protein n=1 Tax=Actinomadura yumaensis TaxID=111807 RepID=A0ABW2CPK9_9ACTN